MGKLTEIITKHRRSIVIIFIIFALLCVFAIRLVSVNYDMVDYLPRKAQSTAALSVMESEFSQSLPNARIMLKDVSVQEALSYKDELSKISGISSISWLDDVLSREVVISVPIEFLDRSITSGYYVDGNALINITIKRGEETSTVETIRSLIGEDNALAGNAVDAAATQDMAISEVINAIAILLPIILLILILSTVSWVEPLLFLITIGIAVVMNMGTNAIFGEISFITQSVSPILQLAVSLDYAIFLLYSFNKYRESNEPIKAMRLAMKKALPTVAASAATTVVGFSALMFMRFGIGSDLGINLVKGVILSFIAVMVFLPALTLICYRLIDKTKHKNFFGGINKAGAGIMKIRTVFLILAVIVVVPAYLAQADTGFIYGTGVVSGKMRAVQDEAMIEKEFGVDNVLVLLVPRKDPGTETALNSELSSMPHISNVVSYVSLVGAQIPEQYVPDEVVEQFYSKNYARIILYTSLPEEGDQTFDAIKAILDKTGEYYDDDYYLSGKSAALYDMKNIVGIDTGIVNLAAVIGIFLVLLITFRSLSIPVFLVFTIKAAIWINLSFAYFTNNTLSFIGYLVISTVQLGATVDYAILMTNHYLINRKNLPKKAAMLKTLKDNLEAVLVSASILATAGFTLAATSGNPIISELGTLLGRGTILSFSMVVFVLPSLLIIFDGLIRKTTLYNGFHIYEKDESIKSEDE